MVDGREGAQKTQNKNRCISVFRETIRFAHYLLGKLSIRVLSYGQILNI